MTALPCPRVRPWPVPSFDPLADYHVVTGKQPKRIFGLHEVARGLPAVYFAAFKRKVPDENFVYDLDPETEHRTGSVTVRCGCDEVTTVDRNCAEPCAGGCGRWFAYLVNDEVRWLPPAESE